VADGDGANTIIGPSRRRGETSLQIVRLNRPFRVKARPRCAPTGQSGEALDQPGCVGAPRPASGPIL